MDVNESIVKTLEHVGVTHVFGGSGQVNGSMLLALEKSEKVKTIIVKNEQAASFMACGYSMFSDRLGVCFATGGPGAFNLFSGMAVALSDSLPVLSITGYVSAPARGKGALNEATGLSRTPDSGAMFSATCKKAYVLENADDICDILEEAINIAFDGRPGPVNIQIPKNLTTATVSNFREIKLDIKPVRPNRGGIEAAVTILAKAMNSKEPVMALVGYGSVRSHAQKELMAFLEHFQIPFASTMDAKGYLPENHALSLGVLGTSGDKGAKDFFDKARIVIAIGNSFAENATYGFKADLYDGKQLIHINIDRHEIGKVYSPTVGLYSDVKPAIIDLHKGLEKEVAKVAKVTVVRDKYFDKEITEKTAKIHPAILVKEISKYLPPETVVLGDAGAHMLWLNCYLNLAENQIYQNPGSFGPMASHVNASMGVKCANPDRPVVAAVGDGDYLMAGFELLTAVENNIPVVWVVFNNGEFNVIKKFLVNMFGRHAYMTFKNPDYVKYAEACGAQGYRVDKIEDFAAVFKKALDSGKPALIDVAVDGEVYPPFALGKV
ncbi:MAG: glyoxylate carboligase [Candidatus Riflebacteria bacterium GWC2_50_8]|nr:MAG: glyoxylate carboligase [Candidatus Riflebacteria bacterium GWC2_50_8]